MTRHDEGTRTVVQDARIELGWGQMQGSGAASGVMAEAITFDKPFASPPIVKATYNNVKSGSAATAVSEFTTGAEDVTVSVSSITTTGFVLRMYKPSVLTSTQWFGYSWMAIGA